MKSLLDIALSLLEILCFTSGLLIAVYLFMYLFSEDSKHLLLGGLFIILALLFGKLESLILDKLLKD